MSDNDFQGLCQVSDKSGALVVVTIQVTEHINVHAAIRHPVIYLVCISIKLRLETRTLYIEIP